MLKKLKQMDSIGIQVSLNYKGNSRLKTRTGGILTCLLYLLFVGGFLYFGTNMYLKRNPNVIQSSEYFDNPPRIDISPQNFPFMLAVDDPTNNLDFFKDSTIYNLKAYLFRQNRTIDANGSIKLKSERIPLDLVSCNLTYHFEGMENEFSNLNLNNAYCIAPNSTIYLKGDFINNEWSMLQFYLYQCSNSTSNNTCKSKEIIDSKLKATYIDFEYRLYYNTPKEYKEPMNKVKQQYFTSMSNYLGKQVNIYLKKINYTTDTGFLTKMPYTKEYVQVDSIREFINNPSPTENNQIFSINIRLASNGDITERTYMKIQNVLANVGGLFKTITLFFIIITQVLFKNYFYVKLINENYNIGEDFNETMNMNILDNISNLHRLDNSSKKGDIKANENMTGSNPSSIRPLKYKDSKEENNMNTINLRCEEFVIPDDKLLKLKQHYESNYKKGRKIKTTFRSYVQHFLCCCCFDYNRLKYKPYYIKGEKMINEALDINNIIKRGIQIDKLIHILLGLDQRLMFHSIPYPNIKTLLGENDNNLYTFEELKGAFKDMRKSNTSISNRVLKLYDKNTLTFLENYENMKTSLIGDCNNQ